ncbi:MAG: HAD family hydrolase [Roseburia sp.]|nr:HAD family hydrolase [Roseburia sp.]
MKKGIIFDMDGTLWDSSENVAKSWDEVISYETKGALSVTTEDIQHVMGHTMAEIAEMLFSDLGEEKANDLMEKCCDYENEYLGRHGGILYPKIQQTLELLSQSYPLYIVSNCQDGYIEAFLEYYDFGRYFADTECFGRTKKNKGDNIALVVERNHLEDAVYVGDIQGDYDSSRQAGIKFIHAAYGFGNIEEKVPAIKEFAELPEVLSQVF